MRLSGFEPMDVRGLGGAPGPGGTGIGASTPGGPGGVDVGAAFHEMLGKARTSVTAWSAAADGDADPATQEARAREAARALVSSTLVQPVLQRMRESNQAAAPFRPNSAERSFRSILDRSLAERIVAARDWPLVEQITRTLLRQPAAAGPEGAGGPQPGVVGAGGAGVGTGGGR